MEGYTFFTRPQQCHFADEPVPRQITRFSTLRNSNLLKLARLTSQIDGLRDSVGGVIDVLLYFSHAILAPRRTDVPNMYSAFCVLHSAFLFCILYSIFSFCFLRSIFCIMYSVLCHFLVSAILVFAISVIFWFLRFCCCSAV